MLRACYSHTTSSTTTKLQLQLQLQLPLQLQLQILQLLPVLTSCGAKAQQTPPLCCASRHSAVSRIDPKMNHVIPWSLHTFPENFMQIGPAVFS